MKEDSNLKEKTKSYIKEYYERYGIGGLLGLVIELDEEKVDKNDVEKHRAAVAKERETTIISHSYLDEQIVPSMQNRPIKEASIYSPEHIEAVKEDQTVHEMLDKNSAIEHPKTLVLEKNDTPNPWGDAKVVLPGQIKL